MRCVVKNKETGRFLATAGEWTEYLSRAQLFPNRLSIGLHLEARGEHFRAEQIEVLPVE